MDYILIGQECIDPFGKINQWISQVNQLDSITCNKHSSTNKSRTKLNTAEKKFDIGYLFTNGENFQDKNPTGWF